MALSSLRMATWKNYLMRPLKGLRFQKQLAPLPEGLGVLDGPQVAFLEEEEKILDLLREKQNIKRLGRQSLDHQDHQHNRLQHRCSRRIRLDSHSLMRLHVRHVLRSRWQGDRALEQRRQADVQARDVVPEQSSRADAVDLCSCRCQDSAQVLES